MEYLDRFSESLEPNLCLIQLFQWVRK